jgi:hypothetical protein
MVLTKDHFDKRINQMSDLIKNLQDDNTVLKLENKNLHAEFYIVKIITALMDLHARRKILMCMK